jgi:hypothetical protein
MRPVEYFLSHQNGDRDDVVDLEGALRRRGLASWRDRMSLLAGDDNDVMIRSGIDRDTTGFVIYGSDRILSSWYVWNREWPWAHARRDREVGTGHPAPYRLVPLLVDGLEHKMLRHVATAAGFADPTTANGEHLRRGDPTGRDTVARWLLRGALADRAAVHSTGPFRVRLTTFPGSHDVEADVLVDWAPEFVGGRVDWPPLQAALADLKAELAPLRRPIEVDAQARLVPAFAFGHAFPLVSRIPMIAIHRDGQRWEIPAVGDPTAIKVMPPVGDETGDPAVALVEVSLARVVATATDVAVTELGLHPGWRASIGLLDGAEIVDAKIAGASAVTFGRILRDLRDRGVREAHVFLAAPAAVALLLGASVNAGPAMTLYFTHEGRYISSVRLPG